VTRTKVRTSILCFFKDVETYYQKFVAHKANLALEATFTYRRHHCSLGTTLQYQQGVGITAGEWAADKEEYQETMCLLVQAHIITTTTPAACRCTTFLNFTAEWMINLMRTTPESVMTKGMVKTAKPSNTVSDGVPTSTPTHTHTWLGWLARANFLTTQSIVAL